ncbi:hypothetical protein [uncultured Amaricoccus sp.]|uniref:hypothetical protein n=1 Tax=uncultured Amaricoccus sp. TaxID=339341 RepID=UPI00345AF42D
MRPPAPRSRRTRPRPRSRSCDLGSANFAAHVMLSDLDAAKLARAVATATRMLDNVIDATLYTIPQAECSNAPRPASDPRASGTRSKRRASPMPATPPSPVRNGPSASCPASRAVARTWSG